MTGFYVYFGSLFFSLFFALLSSYFRKVNYNTSLYFLFLSFFSAFIICALRVDVGSDYKAYIDIFETIKEGRESYVEPGFFLLNYIFKKVEDGHFYVFLFSSFVILLPLFKLSFDKSILFFFILLIFASGFIFRSNNLVRQGIAATFIFLSCDALVKGNNKAFISFIFLSAMFHFSSVFFLVSYFINRANLNRNIIIMISIVLLLFSFLFNGSELVRPLIEFIPYYGPIYSVKLVEQGASSGSNLVVYFWALLSIFIFYYRSNCLFTKVYLLGSILSLYALDLSLVYRFISYMADFKIFSIPLFLMKNVKDFAFPYTKLIFSLVFIVFCYVNIKNGISGSMPYFSIFN